MKFFYSSVLFCLLCVTSYSQKINIGAHIGAGFALGAGANFIPHFKVKDRPGKALWIGGAVGLMAGLSKEFHDFASGYPPSETDLFNTVFGGLVGGVVAREVHYYINKRKLKKKQIVSL